MLTHINYYAATVMFLVSVRTKPTKILHWYHAFEAVDLPVNTKPIDNHGKGSVGLRQRSDRVEAVEGKVI